LEGSAPASGGLVAGTARPSFPVICPARTSVSKRRAAAAPARVATQHRPRANFLDVSPRDYVRWSRSAPNCEKMSLRSGRDVLMEVSRADDLKVTIARRSVRPFEDSTKQVEWQQPRLLCCRSAQRHSVPGAHQVVDFRPMYRSHQPACSVGLIPGSWDKVVALRPASR